MNYLRWLWSGLRGDREREKRNVELTRLTVRSEQAEARSQEVREEQQRLIHALRRTVQVMRNEAHRK